MFSSLCITVCVCRHASGPSRGVQMSHCSECMAGEAQTHWFIQEPLCVGTHTHTDTHTVTSTAPRIFTHESNRAS